MAEKSTIEWTDATWNPITGCSVVSAGCTNCYAMRLAGGRLKNHPSRAGLTRESGGRQVWTGEVRFNPQWLDAPLRWRRPRMIFVCAHGDLFHENVPDEWIDRVFAVMALAPRHTFQVLTKRPERMREYRDSGALIERNGMTIGPRNSPRLWPHVWLGVSVEDQATADERVPLLLDTPAAVRWVSAEPLLGPVRFPARWMHRRAIGDGASSGGGYGSPIDIALSDLPNIDWVVAGGESGPRARPSKADWFRSLRDQCAAAGVPFLFKQWGEYAPDWYNDGYGRKVPESEWMDRFGKKAAGRSLDGVVHDAWPTLNARTAG